MKDYSVRNEKSRLIQATATSLHEHITELFDNGYDQGYEDGKKESCDCKDNMDAEYNRGLNDAWEAIKKITEIPITKRGFVFDLSPETDSSFFSLLKMLSVQEAIAKIKEYEKQKQDTEIKVGDEVITKIGNKGIVITNVPSDEGMISVWVSTCTHVQLYPIKDLVKTGRHFDAIAEVFAEMRGKSE